MDPITGAVIIAGLKYVGQPGAEVIKDFVGRVLGPSGDYTGQELQHSIRDWREKRNERGAALVMEVVAPLGK